MSSPDPEVPPPEMPAPASTTDKAPAKLPEALAAGLAPDLAAAIAAVAWATLPAPPAALAPDAPRLPYRPRPYGNGRGAARRPYTALHVGQRKLHLSEVAFLTQHARPGDTVLYAGAAPGIHIPELWRLFAHLHLHLVLYDPHPYDLTDAASADAAAIQAHRAFFTDEIAHAWAGRDDVLFISDIRSTPDEGGHGPAFERAVAADMAAQQRWVECIQPRAAMLKFRMPYEGDAPVEYLAGELQLQAFATLQTNELRLVATRPYRRVAYDPRRIDDQMFYVNTVLREWAFYDTGVAPAAVEGLDRCHDCALETAIWRRYLRAVGRPESDIAKMMNRATGAIHGRGLRAECHGLQPEVRMVDKRVAVLAAAGLTPAAPAPQPHPAGPDAARGPQTGPPPRRPRG